MFIKKIALKKFKWVLFWLIAIGCMFTSVMSQIPLTENFSEQFGTHYIVLVDSSSDNQRNAENIGKYVPELIFRQTIENKNVPEIPKFRPTKDKISVIFFTIYKTGDPCAQGQLNSALPENMFRYNPRQEFKNETTLESYLESQPCSFKGNASPITTATNVILPFLQKEMKTAPLFSQTYIIVASNNDFNGNRTSPAQELGVIAQAPVNVTDTAQAAKTAANFNRLYKTDTVVKQIKGLFLNISKVEPETAPQAAISYPSSIDLDRAAISSTQLRLAPGNAGGDNITINTKTGDEFSFIPKYVDINFKDENDAPLKLGNKVLQESFRYDLTDCHPPRCIKSADKITIPLLRLIEEDLKFTSDELTLNKGKLYFTIGLNYQTALYEGLYAEAQKVIELNPAQKKFPGFMFLNSEREITNNDLTEYWSNSDKDGLTSDDARNRLLWWRNVYYALLIGVFVLVTIGVFAWLYQKYYHRKFNPKLEWFPSDSVVVDFDNIAESRILVGQLGVKNLGEVPLLGKFFGEESQPSATVNLMLSYPLLGTLGLEAESDPAAIGFIKPDDEGGDKEKGLSLEIKKPVTHGDRIYVFLATENIKDYVSAGDVKGNVNLALPFSFEMHWQTPVETAGSSEKPTLFKQIKRLWKITQKGKVKEENAEATLTLIPEKSRKPVAAFVSGAGLEDDKLAFSGRAERVEIGHFFYSSRSRCRFAQPFTGKYNIVAYRGNVNLGTETIVPEYNEVTIRPKAKIVVPVYIICDGEKVPNPAPVYEQYSFTMLGEYDANNSTPGPHSFNLYRDQEKAEIELQIISNAGKRIEVFWDGSLFPQIRRREGNELKEQTSLIGDELILPSRKVSFDRGSSVPKPLFKLEIGNSAKFGEGAVSVKITAVAEVNDGVKAGIIRHSNKSLDDLIGITLFGEDGFQEGPQIIEIKEGQPSETREIKFNPEWIKLIEGAIVESDKFSAKIQLDITIKQDSKEIIKRYLEVRIPLYLEQLAGKNWLCIDFGTSAIAVAQGASGNIYNIPLQTITKDGDAELASYDKKNTEEGNIKLIPSHIVCDADQRMAGTRFTDSEVKRPGFPHCKVDKESLKPGHPNFIGLPAYSNDSWENSARVIYSLKSWLGRSAKRIQFPPDTQIKYLDGNEVELEEDFVPLDGVLESAFAALYEAYLFDKENQAGQVVITHPNSFTETHKQRLLTIVFKALGKRFEIPLKERFKLISESDAVAYYYCKNKFEDKHTGSDLILVYDFGAGTLDLSLIEVNWEKAGENEGWIIKSRLGIPIAGNYIDQLLARLIDKCLRSDDLKQRYDYQYIKEIVSAKAGAKLKDRAYRLHITSLWKEIRNAKHKWKGSGPLEIKVGEMDRGDWLVVQANRKSLLKKSSPNIDLPDGIILRESDPDNIKSPDTVDLLEKDGNTYLSIPAKNVHNYRLINEFIDFVTKDIIDEILITAGVQANDVSAVVVSGRGALWSGLREKVQNRFQNADKPSYEEQEMKQIVADGAIAWQELDVEIPKVKMAIGVLINNDSTFIPIEENFRELNLDKSSYFRIVEVGLHNPQPVSDMKSLRKHFYNDLYPPINRVEIGWRRREKMFVKKEFVNDKLVIKFKGEDSEDAINLSDHVQNSDKTVEVPWPAGYNFLLAPIDEDDKND